MTLRGTIGVGLLALLPALGLSDPAEAAQGAARVAAAQKRATRQFKSAKQPQPRAGRNRRGGTGRLRPGSQLLERLMRMKPQQRRRFFHENPRFRNLPGLQRRQIQQRLRQLSLMPAKQREQVLERYRLFDRLPREKQTQAREIYQRWRTFPSGRRHALMGEYDSLRAANADARQKRLESKDFTTRFSTDEQQVLKDLTALFPARPRLPRRGEADAWPR